LNARPDIPPAGPDVKYRLVSGTARALLRAFWGLRVDGLEWLPTPPYVVAANHSSEVDPLILGASLPGRLVFLVSRHLERFPLLFRFIRAFDPVFVRRGLADVAGIRATIARLARGEVVVIYPEGRVVQEEVLGPLHAGLGLIALRAAVPVVPVAIHGAARMWPLGTRWPRRSCIWVRIGAPITGRSGDDARSLTARLRDALLDLLGEPSSRAQMGEGPSCV
jgi:1-acyl-sn-glycerol-3-phosphate acyltransferase